MLDHMEKRKKIVTTAPSVIVLVFIYFFSILEKKEKTLVKTLLDLYCVKNKV